MLSPVASNELKRQMAALPLEQWFEVPGWEPAPPPATAKMAQELGPCWLLGDGALAQALSARLRDLGCLVLPVAARERFEASGEPYVVDPCSAEDYGRLLKPGGPVQRPRRIVVAWPLDAPTGGGRIDACAERAFYPVIALARAIANSGDRRPLAVEIITAGAYDVDGTERTEPVLAMVLGPTRVIPLELPNVSVRHIDLGPDAARSDWDRNAFLADRLVAELMIPEPPPVVALRGPVRWLPSLRPVELFEDQRMPAWRRRGAYLITGGLGGIGLALAEHLAHSVQARLALVSRTALPPRARWDAVLSEHDTGSRLGLIIEAIKRIEAAGGVVSAYAADVADPEAMREVRGEVLRRFGRIDGIVHAAGVAGGGLIEDRGRSDIERVLSPKVKGTLALAEVFGDLSLDFLVLCSSLTSFVGGVGQVDYCAANAFLDVFPRSGYPLADRTISINWGGLLGSGMWIPRDGDVGMELPDAIEALRRAVAARLGPRISIAPVRVDDARPWLPGQGQPDGRTAAAGSAPATAELEQRLVQLWSEALEIDDVPLDGHFFELGGNSLLAIELLWRLADELGFRLPMQLLVETATPAAVARAIEARINGVSAAV